MENERVGTAPESGRPAPSERREGSAPAPPTVTFAEAFAFWVKLGFISFGGPAGQIAIMHRELVERRRWLSEERFLHALNYCMLLPGPEAQQLATYIGWLLHRTVGGIVAGGFFVLPSIFVLLGLSYVYAAYGNLPAVAAVLSGFKPVVVAIVVQAILKIGGRALRGPAHLALAVLGFVAIFYFEVPFPLIVLSAGVIGLVVARVLPSLSLVGSTEKQTVLPGTRPTSVSPATVIDDDAPSAPHTLPSGRRALRILAIGIAAWVVPFLAIGSWLGWDSLHLAEYRFFTRAAFVTFGGAYAVLAYVTQAAAGSYGWISQAQAIDGLALAETTPGPLIMVVQFVGFMAGWNHPGDLGQATSAVTGALVTTYATFLPCFLFIFLGAPYIEVLRGHKGLTSALAGVTAAVVGVILNLALVFGTAVIWPRGLENDTNWFAAVVSLVAFLALHRLKIDVLWVVLAGGLVGLATTLVSG
ncbi:MAG TPA: chromate efflux transporter [Vicinamibacteria bacterium]|nr:chromate efflux transporter [Vicinamibacteria bacterium]